MKGIYLLDYGSKCSHHEYIIKDEKLEYMEYIENENLENELILEVTLKKDHYESFVKTKDGEFKSKKMYASTPLERFLFESELPVNFCYDNCEKSGDMFKVNIEGVELYFYKDKSVILYPKNKFCTVFLIKEDGSINFDKPLEYYKFENDGFFCSNYEEKSFNSCINNQIIEYRYLLKKGKISNCIILDECPTVIRYSREKENEYDTYRVRYDQIGILNRCVDENKRLVSRYESFYLNENKEIINTVSIHPLIFDPFNYRYNDKPLKYWVQDKIEWNNKFYIFERDIFKVEPENIEDLIKDLHYMPSKLRIEV